MLAKIDRWWLWMVANLIGMALFLECAVKTWVQPELVNEPGVNSGEGIIWGLTALPILLASLIREGALTGRVRLLAGI